MAINVIEAAVANGVKNLIYTSSSCAYPVLPPGKLIQEDDTMSGRPEPTNRGYAIAKLLGTEFCNILWDQGMNYKTFVPCNLYGPGDNFSENGHVFAALIRKFVDAKDNNASSVTIWGDGTPRREFLHADDAAAGVIHGFKKVDRPIVNVGSGMDISIKELAQKIANKVGYDGSIEYTGELNGVKQKLMSNFYLVRSGWKPKIDLDAGIDKMIQYYNINKESF
jgi:GDP-L-fucose synthase